MAVRAQRARRRRVGWVGRLAGQERVEGDSVVTETVSRSPLSQKPPVVLIPGALNDFVRIVPSLEREKLAHLWIARLDLIAPRPPVIGEVMQSPEPRTEKV